MAFPPRNTRLEHVLADFQQIIYLSLSSKTNPEKFKNVEDKK